MRNFQRSGHPIFRCASALGRGQFRGKEGGRTTILFTVSDDNVQLLLKMVISVNQLSLYGAVADLIRELPDDQRAPRKLVALDQMEHDILTQPPFAEVQVKEERQEKLLQNYERRLKKSTRRPEVIQIVPRSKSEFGRSWTNLLCSFVNRMERRINLMPRMRVTSG